MFAGPGEILDVINECGALKQQLGGLESREGWGRGGDARLITTTSINETLEPSKTWGLMVVGGVAIRSILPHTTGGAGFGFVRGEDGWGVYMPYPSEEATSSVVFCFTSGEVWSVDTYSRAMSTCHAMNSVVCSAWNCRQARSY